MKKTKKNTECRNESASEENVIVASYTLKYIVYKNLKSALELNNNSLSGLEILGILELAKREEEKRIYSHLIKRTPVISNSSNAIDKEKSC